MAGCRHYCRYTIDHLALSMIILLIERLGFSSGLKELKKMDEQTKIAEVDLSEHRFDGSWDWYREMNDKYGERDALRMCTYLDGMASRLKVGGYIDIPKLVTNPEKLGLAVKIACVVCISSTRLDRGPFYEMNNTYTRLIRVA